MMLLDMLPFLPSFLIQIEIARWIFHVGTNIYISNARKYWGNCLHLSILTHSCNRSFEKHANTQAYQLQFASQPLCKIEKHGHHHVDIWMSSYFGDTNGKTLDQTDNFLPAWLFLVNPHNEDHALILICVWWYICFQKSYLFRNTTSSELKVFLGFIKELWTFVQAGIPSNWQRDPTITR